MKKWKYLKNNRNKMKDLKLMDCNKFIKFILF